MSRSTQQHSVVVIIFYLSGFLGHVRMRNDSLVQNDRAGANLLLVAENLSVLSGRMWCPTVCRSGIRKESKVEELRVVERLRLSSGVVVADVLLLGSIEAAFNLNHLLRRCHKWIKMRALVMRWRLYWGLRQNYVKFMACFAIFSTSFLLWGCSICEFVCACSSVFWLAPAVPPPTVVAVLHQRMKNVGRVSQSPATNERAIWKKSFNFEKNSPWF